MNGYDCVASVCTSQNAHVCALCWLCFLRGKPWILQPCHCIPRTVKVAFERENGNGTFKSAFALALACMALWQAQAGRD